MTESQAKRQIAAAARRAGGDSARRHRTTPLLAGRDDAGAGQNGAERKVAAPEQPAPQKKPAQRRPTARRTAAPKAPPTEAVVTEPVVAEPVVSEPVVSEPVVSEPVVSEPAAARPAARRVPARRPVVRAASGEPSRGGAAARPGGRVGRVRAAASRRTPGGARLVAVADAAQHAGEQLVEILASRPSGDSALEQRIATVLAFLRRRLTGDYQVDAFGFDPELTDTVLLNLFRPLYRRWFRVEVRGVENVPDEGGALIVANHAGAIALDALMTQIAIHDEHPRHRYLRMLGADLVFSTPVLGELARKAGATLAGNADAERLLAAGELVGVWPEGFKGIGKPFSERYKLQRFGRGGFVSAALKTRTPIVPCAIVGSEETYPIIGNMPAVARILGLPYAPITPTWPALGPLGVIPLPSKWLIEFGTPLATDELGPGHAEDPMVVFDLTDQVRQTIQQTLYSLLVQRRSVFF